MKIGIDCDGVLRDFISDLKDNIKENYPEHADKIRTPETWNWEDWLPFWTEEESEKYIFEDNYLDFFGYEASPIKSSVEDWPIIKKWAKDNDHELVLVSAHRKQTRELTDKWLEHYNFDFKEPFRSGKQGLNKDTFDFVLTIDKDEYTGKGFFGQDALWLPYGNGAGLKIIRTENNWPHTLDPDQVVKNINYIKEINSEIFPNIKWVTKAHISGQVCVITEMEDVEDIEMEYPRPDYMPEEDFNYYKDIFFLKKGVYK